MSYISMATTALLLAPILALAVITITTESRRKAPFWTTLPPSAGLLDFDNQERLAIYRSKRRRYLSGESISADYVLRG